MGMMTDKTQPRSSLSPDETAIPAVATGTILWVVAWVILSITSGACGGGRSRQWGRSPALSASCFSGGDGLDYKRLDHRSSAAGSSTSEWAPQPYAKDTKRPSAGANWLEHTPNERDSGPATLTTKPQVAHCFDAASAISDVGPNSPSSHLSAA